MSVFWDAPGAPDYQLAAQLQQEVAEGYTGTDADTDTSYPDAKPDDSGSDSQR